ncbi:hypothetical protein [Chromobacterium sphagni]|uniref:Uncharacterized protein n=1 Tax=Chromobacterium sphagni TaxID=1903179 RepID=A0ABX3CFU0_9NEIS|nr:hypothetical protein [Chromobacterium sphagni]OHX21185.1 hypothetical protein BI344_01205 [Chromobacterium sphagni]
MHSPNLTECIHEDEFAVDVIDGEKVLITLPTMLGKQGSEWEGSPIFGRHYLMSLIRRGIENDVLHPADIQCALSRDSSRQSCPIE